jgi:putative zinc finger/helix-turn-helix YgiT family protein
MASRIGDHRYVECGLDSVTLRHIPIHTCDSCGYSEVEIPEIMTLHELIAMLLVTTASSLSGREIRFVRTSMGMTAEAFAKGLRVSKITVSRWENDKNRMNRSAAFILQQKVKEHFRKQRKKYLEMLKDVSLNEEEALRFVESQMTKGESIGRGGANRPCETLEFPLPFVSGKARLALEVCD